MPSTRPRPIEWERVTGREHPELARMRAEWDRVEAARRARRTALSRSARVPDMSRAEDVEAARALKDAPALPPGTGPKVVRP